MYTIYIYIYTYDYTMLYGTCGFYGISGIQVIDPAHARCDIRCIFGCGEGLAEQPGRTARQHEVRGRGGGPL